MFEERECSYYFERRGKTRISIVELAGIAMI